MSRTRPDAMARPMAAQEGRRPELDLMRAFVVAGLIVLHSAMVFATLDWFINDPRPNIGFDIFILWGSAWGMPLLFVVSGMGVRYALRTRSAGVFLRERISRLLVPFVAGMLALVPPMFYMERLSWPGFAESYGHFWLRFFELPSALTGWLARSEWRSGVDSFDVSHLWFLYVLLLLTTTLLPLFLFLRRPAGIRLIDRMAGKAERHPVTLLLAVSIPMALVEAGLGPSDITGGWNRLAYLFPLLAGFVVASNPRFDLVLRRERRRALGFAVVAVLGLVFWSGVLDEAGVDFMDGESPGWSALQGFAGWAWVLAILGYGSSWAARLRQRPAPAAGGRGARSSRLARAAAYANEGVLPFYVLHEPVIVGAAWLIVRWDGPIVAKYFALVIVAFAGTLGLYELAIRRFSVMRFLFGMKRLPSGSSAGGEGPAAAGTPPLQRSRRTSVTQQSALSRR